MACYQLAIRYLTRKRSKTFLLFLIFLLIGSLILATSLILRSAEDSIALMQEKAGAKVVVEAGSERDAISETDFRKIAGLEGVISVNRQARGFAFPAGFSPFTKSESAEEENRKLTIFSYDDLERDSAFFEQRYRLIAGDSLGPDTENGAVVNSLLAEANGLSVGDTIELENGGVSAKVEILGLFISGSERKQGNDALAVNRVENLIFVDFHTYSRMFPEGGYDKVAVYVKDPEILEALAGEIESVLTKEAAIKTSDTLFQQMKEPLEQVIRVVRQMLAFTIASGTLVVTILLCMWMRTRKKEAAILISIGRTKGGILGQALLEAFGVFLASALGACGVGCLGAEALEDFLLDDPAGNVVLDVALKGADAGWLLGIGGCLVLIAVTISLAPILGADPRDTLSKMEG